MINTRTLLGMGLTLALGACASTPRTNGALESARAAVGTAEIDPNVNKYAALDLAGRVTASHGLSRPKISECGRGGRQIA